MASVFWVEHYLILNRWQHEATPQHEQSALTSFSWGLLVSYTYEMVSRQNNSHSVSPKKNRSGNLFGWFCLHGSVTYIGQKPEDSKIFEKHQTCLCSQYPNQDGTMDHIYIVKKASLMFHFFPAHPDQCSHCSAWFHLWSVLSVWIIKVELYNYIILYLSCFVQYILRPICVSNLFLPFYG